MPSEYPMLNVTRRPYHLERRDLYNPLAALDVADMQGLIMQVGVDFALYGTPIPMFAWVSLHTESYGRQECKVRSPSQLLLSSRECTGPDRSTHVADYPVRRREGPSRFMMGVILVLLVSSLLGVISNALFYLVQLPYELGTSVQDVMGLLVRLDIMGTVANNFNVCAVISVSFTALTVAQYLVSDSVVVWRAYILWSDSLMAKGILLSFLTGTLGK